MLGELYGVPAALLPGAISEHGPDTPGRAEDVERLGKAVVVNKARVDGEDPHEQDQIASMEEGVPDLASGWTKRSRSVTPPPPIKGHVFYRRLHHLSAQSVYGALYRGIGYNVFLRK